MLTSAQIRAARAMLRWDQTQLAGAAMVSVETIKRIERLDGDLGSTKAGTLQAIQSALEAAGAIFVAENGEGPGVRLRKKLESRAELTQRIDVIEDDLSQPDQSSRQTPAGGMEKLERAHKREAVTKLKNRRTKLAKIDK
jgi:transcriptional regulator with XRE-family HTH domain